MKRYPFKRNTWNNTIPIHAIQKKLRLLGQTNACPVLDWYWAGCSTRPAIDHFFLLPRLIWRWNSCAWVGSGVGLDMHGWVYPHILVVSGVGTLPLCHLSQVPWGSSWAGLFKGWKEVKGDNLLVTLSAWMNTMNSVATAKGGEQAQCCHQDRNWSVRSSTSLMVRAWLLTWLCYIRRLHVMSALTSVNHRWKAAARLVRAWGVFDIRQTFCLSLQRWNTCFQKWHKKCHWCEIIWQGNPISSIKTFKNLNCSLHPKECLEICKAMKLDKKNQCKFLINSLNELHGGCGHNPKFHRHCHICPQSADEAFAAEKVDDG